MEILKDAVLKVEYKKLDEIRVDPEALKEEKENLLSLLTDRVEGAEEVISDITKALSKLKLKDKSPDGEEINLERLKGLILSHIIDSTMSLSNISTIIKNLIDSIRNQLYRDEAWTTAIAASVSIFNKIRGNLGALSSGGPLSVLFDKNYEVKERTQQQFDEYVYYNLESEIKYWEEKERKNG